MGLETVYNRHNATKGESHVVLAEERGAFIREHKRGDTILDIGCRDGALISHYKDGERIIGVDIDSLALERAQDVGIETIHADLNGDWKFGKFDTVVACEVIEHLYHPDVVLEKIQKSLKPGGVLVGSVPHAFNIQTRLKLLCGNKDRTSFGDPTHINHFAPFELWALLERHFINPEVFPITTPRWRWFPLKYSFCHTLLFKARRSWL